MESPQAESGRTRAAAITQVVDDYIASLDAGLATDVDSICRQFPTLMPELSEKLRIAERIRKARLQATRSSPSNLSDDVASDSAPFLPSGRNFDVYDIVRRLGVGGFGAVFLAKTPSTNELVAIKILHPQYARDANDLKRFRREADCLMRLDHPHLVRVFKIGEYQGHHFIVMRYIDGFDLEKFAQITALTPDKAAKIVLDAARACHYAHLNQVIHRDIKPQNILLESASDKAFVTDFGLALFVDASRLTADQEQVGTRPYMAPEQFEANLGDVGAWTDVYGLGATLYYLIAGNPPAVSEIGMNTIAIVRKVLGRETTPLVLGDGGDLNTICLKCLQEAPQDRYQTASELADDLQRFLSDVPIKARLPGPLLRSYRICQRRPKLAVLLGTLILCICSGAWLSVSYAMKAQHSAAQVTYEQGQTKLANQKQLLRSYAADLQDANLSWQRGEVSRTKQLLSKYDQPSDFDPREFEWYFLRKMSTIPTPTQFISAGAEWNRVTFDATGKRLAGLDCDGKLTVWDVATSNIAFRVDDPPLRSAVFSPDGKYCVTPRLSLQAEVDIRDAIDGHILQTLHLGQWTSCVAIHPDGDKMLLANGQSIYLVALPSGEPLQQITKELEEGSIAGPSLDVQHGTIFDMAFSPDGKTFAAGFEDGIVQLWNWRDRRIVWRTSEPQPGPIAGVAFSSDGSRVAGQGIGGLRGLHGMSFENGYVMVFESETGKSVCKFSPHLSSQRVRPFHSQLVGNLSVEEESASNQGRLTVHRDIIPFGEFRPAFSQDGKQVFTTGPRSVQVWDAHGGELIEELVGHDGLVVSVAVSPDGKQIAGAGANRSIRVWPADQDQTCTTICSHPAGIRQLAISPQGDRLAAICERLGWVEYGEGGERQLRSDRRMLRVWDSRTGQEVFQSDDVKRWLADPHFDPTGREITCSNRRFVLATGQASTLFIYDPEHVPEKPDIWLSLAGDVVVPETPLRNNSGIAYLRDGERNIRLAGNLASISASAVSMDGNWIAIGFEDGIVRLWSTLDGAQKYQTAAHTGAVTALAFDAKQSQFASGGSDGRIVIWNVSSGEKTLALAGHRREVTGLAFAPDGNRLVSSSGSLDVLSNEAGEVLLWNLDTGLRCLELRAGVSQVYGGVVFSPDGQRIYASANGLGELSPGRIVVWNAPRGD